MNIVFDYDEFVKVAEKKIENGNEIFVLDGFIYTSTEGYIASSNYRKYEPHIDRDFLEHLRDRFGITQQMLADAMDMSRQTFSNNVKETRRPRIDSILAVRDAIYETVKDVSEGKIYWAMSLEGMLKK